MNLADAVLAVMLQLAPPEKAHPLPGHEETVEAMRARYAATAEAIVDVGKTREGAALILAVAFHEGGFAHDLDEGETCYRGPGYERRCDSGRATCAMQLQLPHRQAEQARKSRRVCFTLGLQAIRRSLATCATNAPQHRFAMLSGSCSRGLAGSRAIYAIHRRTDGLLGAALAASTGPS